MNRGELSLKMSRKPKTFLVLLLVAMFLMTQVAVAGAWYVDWGTWQTSRTAGSTISGTIYNVNTNAKVYAQINGVVVNSPTLITSGNQFSFSVGSTAGTKNVSLIVYENNGALTSTSSYVYENITRLNTDPAWVGVTYNALLFSIPDQSSPGPSGSPSSTDSTTPVTPTVPTSASGAVTAAAGGTITADGITVSVPAGALSGDGNLSVTPVTDLTSTPVTTGLTLGSTVVDIILSGATLNGTVDITLNYDTAALAGVPAEQIGVYYWNPNRAGWLYCGGTADTASGKVTVGVNHFTKFAVMANKNLKIPTDITGNWAYDSIKRLLGMGVVSGYTDGTYKPGNNITRAEFAKIMVDALGWKATAAPSLKFADAAQIGDWAKGYVATAVEKGLIAGYSDNTFKPANQITRAEIATIVVKALGKTAEGTPVFADASGIPAWAQGYVAVAAKEGIVAGYSDKTFKAGNNATRAEAAKMATNMLTNLKI